MGRMDWIVGGAALSLFFTAMAGGADISPVSSMLEPEADFRVEAGRVVGPWRHSARPRVVCFNGPFAQFHPAFAEVGRTVAARVGGRFEEIRAEDLRPAPEDANGALLYPDGAPRVFLFFMPGGNAAYTLADIAGVSDPRSTEAMAAERSKLAAARGRAQRAFRGGMNYVGVCGGFFAAASGYTDPRALHTGWGLWPGRVAGLGPVARPPLPDVVFEGAEANHPLARAAGGALRAMPYHGGPLGVARDAPDTEYLGRYRGGNMPELEGDTFLAAYRAAGHPAGGRCVIATGHPEIGRPDFLLAMALYAADHAVETPIRPLELGRPAVGIIGDDQLQYYRVSPPAAGRLRVALAGLDADCDLYLRAGLPPTPRRFDAKSAAPGLAEERIEHAALRGGAVYIAVHGRHALRNGARYALIARWD